MPGNGWADWGDPREPRATLEVTGAQVIRYCPKCRARTVFEPAGDTAALSCRKCRYRAGDDLTDAEVLLMVDHFNLPLPTVDSRIVP